VSDAMDEIDRQILERTARREAERTRLPALNNPPRPLFDNDDDELAAYDARIEAAREHARGHVREQIRRMEGGER